MRIQFSNYKHFIFLTCSVLFLVSCQNDLEESQEEITTTNLITTTTRNTSLSDRFQYFYRGNSRDNIYTSQSTTGTGGWSNNVRINGLGLTKYSVRATQFGSQVAVACVGRRNTHKIYYGLSGNGNSFGPERIVPGAQTSETFSMIEFNDDLFVYHRGRTSGKSRMFYSILDGTTNAWSQNRELPNSPLYNDFDFVVVNDVLYMIVVNSSQIIVKASADGVNFTNVNTQNLQLPAGTGIPISISIAPQALVPNSSFPNLRDYYMIIGTDTNHVIRTSTRNFTTFTPRVKVRVNNSDVRSDNDVSIASNGSRLVLAYEAESGNSIRFAYSNDGTNWIGNTNATGGTSRSGVDIIYMK